LVFVFKEWVIDIYFLCTERRSRLGHRKKREHYPTI